jgi:cobalt-zinc-cadmium efflux system protein
MSDHNHDHHHQANSNNIGLVFFLNFFFTIIEFIGGVLTGSTAIMADAVHDLGDTLSIGLAWVLSRLSKKHANDEFTYGFHRFSLLGALINGMVLVIGSAWVLSEAIPKLLSPEMPHAQGMFWLAILGVTVNGYAAWKISGGKTLNERVLNWHLLEDVLGWVSVLIVSVILLFWDWPILDPLLSIAFTLFILMNVIKNTYQTIKLFLQSVPDDKLLDDIRNKLNALEHVSAVHHIHLWSLDGEKHVLTAHLEIDKMISIQEQKLIKDNVHDLLAKYSLAHTTIEFELPDETCRDNN